MAILTEQQPMNQATSKNDKKKCDGYLNLKLTDKHGTVYSIPAYIPLDAENAVHRALLKYCEDGAREFNIIGYVNKAQDQSKEIEL